MIPGIGYDDLELAYRTLAAVVCDEYGSWSESGPSVDLAEVVSSGHVFWMRPPSGGVEAVARVEIARAASPCTRPTDCKERVMNIFIWERVDGVTHHYHAEGAVLVVAEDLNHAREVWRVFAATGLNQEALNAAGPDHEYATSASAEPEVLVFEDVGCCG